MRSRLGCRRTGGVQPDVRISRSAAIVRTDFFRRAVLGLVLLMLAAPASAHPGSVAFWKITFHDAEARSQILVSLLDFGWTADDLASPDRAGGLTQERLGAIATEILAHFAVYEDDTPAPAQVLATQVLPSGSLEVRATHRLTDPATARSLRATFHELTDDTHRVIARVERDGEAAPLVFTAVMTQHLLPDAAPAPWYTPFAPAGSARAMLLLGIEHILTGYDHLVFLGCLLVPGGTWRSRVAIVTAFTLAHSVTLVLAAMQVVTPPDRFVEAAIAFSIAYVAIENLLWDGRRSRWPTAFGFGLIHGFGFAAMLDVLDMPVGQWLTSVVAFNAGVEIGQLAVVAVAVPVVAVIARRSWHRRLVQCTSVLVCGLAAVWILERLQ